MPITNIKFINVATNAFRLKGGSWMSLKSKLKIESVGIFAAFVFYAIVGIICFAVLATVDFSLIHIGIIGVLSLITAYGLFKKRIWSLWVVIVLFFIATTFSAYMLYYTFWNTFLDVSMFAYLILTWFFTAYTAAKRKTLES